MKTRKKISKTMKILISLIVIATAGVGGIGKRKRLGKVPKGERLKRVEASKNDRDGKFVNKEHTPQFDHKKNSDKDTANNQNKVNRKPLQPIEAIKTDLHSIDKDSNIIVWFGHSSYYIQLDGKRYFIDPVFYAASPVSFIMKPFPGTDIYKPCDIPNIDYLIITHDHWDHLDYKTVTELRDRIANVVCPLGVGQHFEYWKFDTNKIIELDWDECSTASDQLKIHCLPARHFSNRSLRMNRTLWASFLIQSQSYTIYIGGDSGYGKHYKEIGERFPNIDLALLENGQYNIKWQYIHLMPHLMPKAAKELGARRFITGHHLKFALSEHSWNEPYKNIEAMRAEGLDVIDPKIGEIVELK